AGLFVSSLSNVRGLRTGFDVRQIVFGGVQFDTRDSVRDAREPHVFVELAERLRQAPGVEQVALARMAPTRGFSTVAFYPDVDTTQFRKPFATYNIVSPEFFAATGMRMLRGEGFTRITSGGSAIPAVVVNDAMAKAQWPGMNAVGRCLRFAPNGQCYTVIGVAETALFSELLEASQSQFYLPWHNPPAEVGRTFGSLVVRARPGARDMVTAEVQRAIRDAFPGGRPLVNTMERFLDPQYRPWRLGATLFTSFGVLALIVAALGIYSTVAYSVAQQTHEFGVRTAIGARTHDILRQVIGNSLRTVALGVVAGIGLAIVGGRFVAALLYGIEPSDPWVISVVAIGLLVIAAAAAVGPAWRAARSDPLVALRAE
ncbi:MAG: FtsX-like permease family protein, partial [Gemmatimonadaceae bacterium]